jgi:hypothetical protein
MSGKNHNKKRNSILLYEFLVRTISKALVENDKKISSTALRILRRHFKPGTELYKEFRLLNALAKTTVSSEHVASSILHETKLASNSIDSEKLDKEKSLLIKNINHFINDENFYDQHVHEYRIYASSQSLFNEWRSKEKDIGKIAQFEDQLMKWLLADKNSSDEHYIAEDSSGTARMLMKIMSKKLNEKYSGVLNEQQRSLIKAYAFSTASEDVSSIKLKLSEIKSNLLQLVESYSDNLRDNDYIKNKLSDVKQSLLEESLETINDETVTRFMLYSKLVSELENGD